MNIGLEYMNEEVINFFNFDKYVADKKITYMYFIPNSHEF